MKSIKYKIDLSGEDESLVGIPGFGLFFPGSFQHFPDKSPIFTHSLLSNPAFDFNNSSNPFKGAPTQTRESPEREIDTK
jgi:hypothetical protein